MMEKKSRVPVICGWRLAVMMIVLILHWSASSRLVDTFSSLLLWQHHDETSAFSTARQDLDLAVPNSFQYDTAAFNYTAFWEEAVQHINPNLSMSSLSETYPHRRLENCPKVYVYPLSPELHDEEEEEWNNSTTTNPNPKKERRNPSLNFTHVFGGDIVGLHRHSGPQVLEHRILTSKHCRTQDPSQADLFYIPIFPESDKATLRTKRCQTDASITPRLLAELTHLTPATACRHFFYFDNSYDSVGCWGWWRNPVKKLAPVLRVSILQQVYRKKGGNDREDGLYAKKVDANQIWPNGYSMPYVSSVHWKRQDVAPFLPQTPAATGQQPPQGRTDRSTFLLFGGKTNHGDVLVREKVADQCRSYNDTSKCHVVILQPQNANLQELFTAKTRSIFCLEPSGDTPDRKSMSDSIASGCIPVFFGQWAGKGQWSWFWDDWKGQAMVRVPRGPFLRGEVDLYTLLHTTMPPAFRQLMQDTLALYARQFQISFDEDEHDAVRVLLDGLKQQVQTKVTPQGTCAPMASR